MEEGDDTWAPNYGAQPSEVKYTELELEEAIVDFLKWAGPRAGPTWQMIRELCPVEKTGSLKRRGSLGMDIFVQQVRMLGFQGDIRRVYEIMSYNHQDGTCSETIELRQILQFQRNYETFEDAGQYLADAFTEFLRKRHGVVIRAWRRELDKYNKGKIAQKELGSACKRLGFEVTNVKKLWTALKQLNPTSDDSRTMLTLADVAEIEVMNMERFACIVWDELGSLDEAWRTLDPHGANLITFAHFEKGCDAIGFEGDRRTLFLGLDLSGCGRLLRPDLEILNLWAPEHVTRSWTDEDLGIHFSRWIDVHFEGPDPFFHQLDDGDRGRLSLEEFVGAAKAHGYTGSHRQLQRLFNMIARGNAYITSRSLARFHVRMGPLIVQNQETGGKIARRGMSRSASEHQLQQRPGNVEKTREEILKIAELCGWREIVNLVDLPRAGAETPRIRVEVFIRRLRKLAERQKEDLDIEPRALKSMLARAEGWCGWVSKRDILLLRKRLGPAPMFEYTPPQRPTEKSIEMMRERPSWSMYVGDQGALNVHLSAVTRTYFGVFLHNKKDRQRDDPPPPHILPENLRERPKWNPAVTTISDSNSELPSATREYFSKLNDKPIRDKMRRNAEAAKLKAT
eukprot:gnl/MRDRNA2_/MRDRNA2_93744_c0_seq1.p1 gnl/MRDRNA2_/MRDRNA2_93744_c0~~gnl/MRDRNA2_/MRDRNA2_93744_c0_seq1.p1  ORF type:complete len:625 (+),score=108.34 gnl/MRDRNA2_/MRDRNA2_93744_c0_seq1:148-2022(+)